MENKWGNTYWIFLHNFCNKIDEDYFKNNKTFVLNTVKLICTSLPCETCSQHAKYSLDKYNYNNINNKENLKKLLFDFHNHINHRLNKPIQDISILNKYDTCNFNISCNNYIKLYYKYNNSNIVPKLMMHKFHNNNNFNIIKTNINKIFYN